MRDTAFLAKVKLTGIFVRAVQSKPTRLPLLNNSNQETPTATNKSLIKKVPANVIDEEVPIGLGGRSSQESPEPAKEKLLTQIGALNKKIASYSELIFKQSAEVRPDQKKQLKNLREEKEKKEKILKQKIIKGNDSKKLLEKKPKVLADLKKDHPNVASKLEKHESRKKPAWSYCNSKSQPGLHQAIFEIIAPISGADKRRRREVRNSVRTLDDLHGALEEKGSNLSQTARYYHLIPENVNHKDYKRGVNIVFVNLLKPRDDLRTKHIDGHFAKPRVKQTDEIAELFPKNMVLYIFHWD